MMAADAKSLNGSTRVWIGKDGEPIDTRRALDVARDRESLSRRQQALLAAAGESGPHRRWYVLTIAAGADKAVDNALAAARVERWMPVKEVEAKWRGGRKGRRPDPIIMPALPGYLFVKVANCAAAWAGLARIKGVLGVLGGADQPSPVSDDTVLKMRVFIDEDPEAIMVLTNALKVGDPVTIDAGPFAMFPGVVDEVRDNGRLVVEAMVFGRATTIELDLAMVTKSR